ncbi:MAG: SET domain-containing protein-lysine N-methyltransferase [Candidatus Omnitrophica bacterium]|nr:SET domain-containing protein-lysine N-methyltransferase [Candidatus Omnitrophota bacterium]
MRIAKTTSSYITVRTSTIHGRGVFAKQAIPKDTRIIEYNGEKITKAESERRADIPLKRHQKNKNYGAVYIFELNKRHDIDGNVPYNTARYINHSCTPNAEVDIIRGKIWIIALRDIAKGEEIFYNYGYNYDAYEDHRCFCETERCVGYILAEEHWPKLKKDSKRKKKTLEHTRK